MRKLIVPSLIAALASGVLAVPALASTSGSVSGTATLGAGTLSLTPPAGITFGGQLSGQDLQLNDTNALDKTMQVTDATGSNQGWNVSAYETAPLTYDSNSLPSNSLSLNGSSASLSSTASPTVSCATGSTCTLATNVTTYPVSVTTGQPGNIIYSANPSSGEGTENVSSLQWWLSVPSNAVAGQYTTTVVMSLSSGPGGTASPTPSGTVNNGGSGTTESSYSKQVAQYNPEFDYPLEDTNTLTAVPSSGNLGNATYTSESGQGVAGPASGETGINVASSPATEVTTPSYSSNTWMSSYTSAPKNDNYVNQTFVAWFKTTSTGGTIFQHTGSYYCDPNKTISCTGSETLSLNSSGQLVFTFPVDALSGNNDNYVTANSEVNTSESYNNGQWHQVAIVESTNSGENNGVVDIYVDGVDYVGGGSGCTSGSNATLTADSCYTPQGLVGTSTIGQSTSGSNPFPGDLAEVSVINNSLSSSQISNLYNLYK